MSICPTPAHGCAEMGRGVFQDTNITDLTEGLECYFCFCSSTICPDVLGTVMGVIAFKCSIIVLVETIRYSGRPTIVNTGIKWTYRVELFSVRGTKEDPSIRLWGQYRVGLLRAGLMPGLCGAMSRGFVLVVMTPLWLSINLEMDKTIYKCVVAIPFWYLFQPFARQLQWQGLSLTLEVPITLKQDPTESETVSVQQ